MNSGNNSPYLQNGSPANPPVTPQWVTPSVQIPIFPAISEITQSPAVPSHQKPRYGSYDMVKVILRNKPITVFCPSCKLNIMTDIRGRSIVM